MTRMTGDRPATLALLCALAACGPGDEPVDQTLDGAPLPRRAGALVIDSCPMDSFQRATLDASSTRQVIDEVILLCLAAREDGSLGDDASMPWLLDDVNAARAGGYRVSLGLTVGEAPLVPYDGARNASLLAQPAWRAQVIAGVKPWVERVDGLEVALPPGLPSSAHDSVTALVRELSSSLRPARTLGLFAPPSTDRPSDVDGGEAYDLLELAPSLDRVRVMTLDWSCCERPGGPSTDPAWATAAVQFATLYASSVPVSVTMPLFGTDFSDQGARSVTFLEAHALADYHRARIERDAGGSPHFSYTDAHGRGHELWFDDTFSTALHLGVLAHTLPLDVSVLYYGLGAEEPTLWQHLARSQP